MACMTHTCTRCNWMQFNNLTHSDPCPKCGAEVYSVFDEDPTYLNDDLDEEDQDECEESNEDEG